MKNISAKELKEYAKQLRKTAVTMIYEAQSGHPGGSLSIADIVACLYFREMNVDPKNPRWADRDRFVLSKGHVCPIQYSALGLLGFFPEEDLHTLPEGGFQAPGPSLYESSVLASISLPALLDRGCPAPWVWLWLGSAIIKTTWSTLS